MRAVWYDRQGAADDVLVCGELPTPEAGHGEVRVRLKASGVRSEGALLQSGLCRADQRIVRARER